jgi:hypothetical protein
MNDFEIQCPHCGDAFELTEALAAPLLEEERKRVDAEVKHRLQAEVAAAEAKGRAAGEADSDAKVRAAEALAQANATKLRQAQE